MILSFVPDPSPNYSVLLIFRSHIPVEANLTFGDSDAE